mmetsp:Transcript_850/g.1950  ORF Transcript_850/g.1950 Transcript_850/m.1950 type:complete len:578 (-) Transcript_850:2017-3750(-)
MQIRSHEASESLTESSPDGILEPSVSHGVFDDGGFASRSVGSALRQRDDKVDASGVTRAIDAAAVPRTGAGQHDAAGRLLLHDALGLLKDGLHCAGEHRDSPDFGVQVHDNSTGQEHRHRADDGQARGPHDRRLPGPDARAVEASDLHNRLHALGCRSDYRPIDRTFGGFGQRSGAVHREAVGLDGTKHGHARQPRSRERRLESIEEATPSALHRRRTRRRLGCSTGSIWQWQSSLAALDVGEEVRDTATRVLHLEEALLAPLRAPRIDGQQIIVVHPSDERGGMAAHLLVGGPVVEARAVRHEVLEHRECHGNRAAVRQRPLCVCELVRCRRRARSVQQVLTQGPLVRGTSACTRALRRLHVLPFEVLQRIARREVRHARIILIIAARGSATDSWDEALLDACERPTRIAPAATVDDDHVVTRGDVPGAGPRVVPRETPLRGYADAPVHHARHRLGPATPALALVAHVADGVAALGPLVPAVETRREVPQPPCLLREVVEGSVLDFGIVDKAHKRLRIPDREIVGPRRHLSGPAHVHLVDVVGEVLRDCGHLLLEDVPQLLLPLLVLIEMRTEADV